MKGTQFVVGMLLVVFLAPSIDASFTPLNRFGNYSSGGIAWGDYDRDRDIDLAVAAGMQIDPLYENLGNDNFFEISWFGLLGWGMAWADYNNDGFPDLAITGPTVRLFTNQNATNFTEDTLVADIGRGLSWGDYDNDGDADLAVGTNGQNKLFRNEGNGNFTELDKFGQGITYGLTWGDYNNDGDPDLAVTTSDTFTWSGMHWWVDTCRDDSCYQCTLWVDTFWIDTCWYDTCVIHFGDSAVWHGGILSERLYRNEGNDLFTESIIYSSDTLLLWNPTADFQDLGAGAWGDYDNDGDLDLALALQSPSWWADNLHNKLCRNEGNDSFTVFDEFGSHRTSNDLAWADYDNDGDLDIVIAHWLTDDYLYTNNGNGTFTESVIVPYDGRRTWSIAWGDHDNDGDLDIAVSNSGQHLLLKNNLNKASDTYIVVKAIGSPTNRGGIGVKVKLYTTDFSQLLGYREISAGSGFGSMSPSYAHFGVASNDTFAVEITWPITGRVDTLSKIPSGTSVEVDERMGVEIVPHTRSSGLLAQNYPNPFTQWTEIHYTTPKDTDVKITVYDISGREVLTLIDEAQKAGSHMIRWDGNSSSGSKLSSGIYFYKIITSANSIVGRMCLIR